MLEKIADMPAGVDALQASGKVSKEDYERVFEPLVEEARQTGRRIRLLYHFGPDFRGFTPSGAWEDAKLGLRLMRLFQACAVVTDENLVREGGRLAGFLMPCPVRVFSNEERGKAVEWLQSLPAGAGVSHRLVPESGVIVVEVKEPLSAQDFDALAATADGWLENHQNLRGLVIHVHKFPGWENLGSFFRHIRFVRDHQRRVKRIAWATDTKLANVAPLLAEHFVEAQIRTFGYDEINSAISWAAEESESQSHAPTSGPRSSASL